MPFVLFNRDDVTSTRAAAVTVQKRGTITFNHAAYKLMGEPKAVQLLFDPGSGTIGVRPCPIDAPSSYELRQQSRKEQAPMAIPSTAFVQHFGIDTRVSRRYAPTWQDDMLLVDLAKGGVEVVRTRTSRASTEDSTESDADSDGA